MWCERFDQQTDEQKGETGAYTEDMAVRLT